MLASSSRGYTDVITLPTLKGYSKLDGATLGYRLDRIREVALFKVGDRKRATNGISVKINNHNLARIRNC